MARYGEAPVKKLGTKSRASKQKRAKKALEKDQREQRRLGVVRFALAWLKEDENRTLNGAYPAAVEAYDTKTLIWEPPSRAPFYAP